MHSETSQEHTLKEHEEDLENIESSIHFKELFVRSTDLQFMLNLSPATMTSIYKKLSIKDHLSKGKRLLITEVNSRKILLERGFKLNKQGYVVSLLINKGGAGKSTFTYFLSLRLASYGLKILVIDTDPQGNSTSSYRLDEMGYLFDEETPVLSDIVAGNATFEGTIKKISANLDLLPSHPMNNFLADHLKASSSKNISIALDKIIKPIRNNYDIILIDCAPALGLTNEIISCGSNLIIMPIYPDPFSEMSVTQTLNEISTIEKDFKSEINKKILFNRYDRREKTSIKYLGKTLEKYPDLVMQTYVQTTTDFKNAIDSQEDLFGPKFNKGKGAKDIDELTKEILLISEICPSETKETLSH